MTLIHIMGRLALIGVCLFGTLATAATFRVDSTTDEHDANVGDHHCATETSVCTLRAAIEEANSLRGVVNIGFSLPSPSVLTLTLGELAIGARRGVLRIHGPGNASLAVDGNHAGRVLSIDAGATVIVSGITLRNGFLSSSDPWLESSGAGIRSLGTLTLIDAAVTNNVNGNYTGGGISNSGSLVLVNSTVRDNTASMSGGGILNSGSLHVFGSTVSGNQNLDEGTGGGITNTGTATLDHTVVSSNYSGFEGGGIHNSGDLRITDSTLHANSAAGGGGIENRGTAILRNVTVSANIDVDHGGGIANRGGSLTLVNSTVSGNHAFGLVGGIGNTGALSLINTTVSDNFGDAQVGGLANLTGGTVSFQNSIVAGNHADPTESHEDCGIFGGTVLSQGYDLFGEGTGCPPGPSDVTIDPDLVSTFLGALQDNGGPTSTMALLDASGNPAVDGGDPAGCKDEQGDLLRIDQRHQRRPPPSRGRCDIGAFEKRERNRRQIPDGQDPPVSDQADK